MIKTDKLAVTLLMIQGEPKDHSTDSHFCLTNILGSVTKSTHTAQHPSLSSIIRLVLHSGDLPVPRVSKKWHADYEKESV
jgi:hypothetical protein